jgi:flagellar biosynthesis protein FliR
MIKTYLLDPEIQKYFLIFARISGLVIFAPPFMNNKLSIQLKGALVLAMTLGVSTGVYYTDVIFPSNFIELTMAMFFELCIGFIIGFAIQILFVAFQLAGEFIDRHIGFAMASLVDPQTDITVSILGSLLMNLGLFLFLDIGGHNLIIRSFVGSFHTIPLLNMEINQWGLIYHISELFFKSLKFAAEFALPVIIFVTMIYAIQGFLQRTIPQLQIFVVGFIFTITAGLLSIRLLLQHFIPVSEELIQYFQDRIWFIITNLNNG